MNNLSVITNEEVIANSEYSIKLKGPSLVRWLRHTYDIANLGMGILPRDGICTAWYNFNHCGSSWYIFLDTDGRTILQCHTSLSTGAILVPQNVIDSVDQILTCGNARMSNDKVVQFKYDVIFSAVFGDTMYNMSIASDEGRCKKILEHQNAVIMGNQEYYK